MSIEDEFESDLIFVHLVSCKISIEFIAMIMHHLWTTYYTHVKRLQA